MNVTKWGKRKKAGKMNLLSHTLAPVCLPRDLLQKNEAALMDSLWHWEFK